ncbi:unnamed protein product [Acanthoscelides obtectus]|uniref:Retinol dehydrogenase 14 n=1 Tax=Acanthoscelides obtectus TaxID=200917 RepID=A0A9P0PCU2_ACAOB|nr:unnamed protein product [Acanthoscelides obtectus]CAK1654542.1 Retinol dehydrogenase 14 [Acanthoscelides obtectus]
MTVVDFSHPETQAVAAVAVVGVLTAIALLKLYAYLSCGYFHERVKMEGKTVVITGANGGIGKETAREIAKRGARVVMGCRNMVSGKKARDEIAESTNNQNIIVKKLDLSSQKSIREFAEDVLKTEPRLDVLIHNAGTAESKFQLTEDGIELTMATNHFGPYLLTHLLIDLLKRSKPSRIVIVASELYRFASLDPTKINPQSSWFPPYLYYVSKYANICFTAELARRLEGTGVTANCLHPGMIDSGIWRNMTILTNLPIISGFFKTPRQGCQTSVYLACSEDVQNVTGKYFMDCAEASLSSSAKDESKAKKLWEETEKYIKFRPEDPKI